jgi:hypothetical protein
MIVRMLSLAVVAVLPVTAGAEPIRFNRDVLPILADKCFHCHGPDSARRKADLRLDREEDAKRKRDDVTPIVAGKPDQSELIRRITSKDADERMPPKGSGRELSASQIEVLSRWVSEGAKWEKHWAFVRPERPDPPAVKNVDWPRTAIDRFILARLEKEGLRPSPETDRVILIRRMSIDLTGLPPTPEEVDQFVRDTSPGAVERLADRLLASPRYGERMAWRWLEAARYADTNGYQTDAERYMWRWRDWVIDAYNRNLPYDQFTIEQIAGDLLPSPTLEQRIATGFNRNHRGNGEGGIIPEEYLVEYVADRVETTATVWLGLTLGCARCHDHKYDPFSQKEFYKLFAFFNNVPEKGRAEKYGNSPPLIKAPTPEQAKKLHRMAEELYVMAAELKSFRAEEDQAQVRWEKSVKPAELRNWSPDRGQVVYWPLDEAGSLKMKDGVAEFRGGRLGNALDLDGKRYADAGDVGHFGFDDRFSFSFWIKPRGQDGAIISRMPEEPEADGYSIRLVNGNLQVHLTKRWLDDALRVESTKSIRRDEWRHVTVTYDGSHFAAGVRIYIDGVEDKPKVLLDELNQSFDTKEPLRIGSGGGPASRLNGLIDEVRVYSRVISAEEAQILAVGSTIGEILAKRERSEAEAAKLRAYFLEKAAPQDIRKLHERFRVAKDERQKFEEYIPTVMVMEEMPTPRDTFVLIRGQYDRHGEKVTANTPAELPALKSPVAYAPGSPNRLDLAKWLVSPENPLTARVAVNRIWQLHFGAGLVRTAEDFGTQGDFPSHPELLDWLATEFVRTGWDVKRMHKLIVTSAVYRQSSRLPIAKADNRQSTIDNRQFADPDNRLLSRFPRRRLSAEMIRDQALFASGLLVERQGGPSVKPYQPPGLWNELSGVGDYTPDTGEKLYRRGLYTFWKRTVAPPALSTFDAAGREACWVRESRTNTPLQALTLLNETSFVEASRKLAERVMREANLPDERLTLAFRRVVSRNPSDTELRILHRALERQLAEYRKDPAAAKKVLAIGESKLDGAIDPVEVAAYAAVCRLILNLDEAVTRE